MPLRQVLRQREVVNVKLHWNEHILSSVFIDLQRQCPREETEMAFVSLAERTQNEEPFSTIFEKDVDDCSDRLSLERQAVERPAQGTIGGLFRRRPEWKTEPNPQETPSFCLDTAR
jgi:hypothetical protein